MFNNPQKSQPLFEEFYIPFGGQLRSENRWVVLSKQVPWDKVEQQYAKRYGVTNKGCPAKNPRVAFGALIIKERLGLTDRETVEQIRENPYLQYFIGFKEYIDEEPFHHSMMTHFRKVFDQDSLSSINDELVKRSQNKSENDDDSVDGKTSDTVKNKGKLIVDATCTPADITYPTDLGLLNAGRELTEKVIDIMHKRDWSNRKKPRTYRRKARKAYLATAKKKRPGKKAYRKANGKQLQYLCRNLNTIKAYAKRGMLTCLPKREYRLLLVVSELYRQQKEMHETKTNRIDNRITSIYQPHVRPIVRGKSKAPVEFGAKISVSLVDGFSFVDRINWEAYNESGDLKSQVENYKQRYGYYPASVHADQIYRTRENRKHCKTLNIRLSGPPLGRRASEEIQKEQKKQQYQDEIDRIAIEGKFGQSKRRFSLARVMSRLSETSVTTIMVSFIVMNLEKVLAQILFCLIGWIMLIARLGFRQFKEPRKHLALA